ncbi:MAG: hypothetical protein CL792_00705 [Chloroflexi bacterium]|nr:hypothetical protein [Chloroflexota bacterium]|tara:strand:+ start:13203 stop:14243 length:1041 start_codon:yes stop_codon:yes gene_type:complete
MSNEKLRIGFIGAGGNTTSRHIPGFQSLNNIELTAVCNRTIESSTRVANQFGIEKVVNKPEDIFDSPEIDAVCIGTWPYRHSEYSIAALQSGKHVLCEARMAMNVTEAESMLAIAKKHPNLVAQIVPAPMDLPVWQTVRRLINEQKIGELREVHVDVLNGTAIDETLPLHWRHQKKYSGMNIMMFGIFAEIVTRWTGKTKSLVADAQVFIPSRNDTESGKLVQIEIPDSLGVFAKLESDIRVTYRISTVINDKPSTSISLYGSEAALHWDGRDHLTLSNSQSEKEIIPADTQTAIGWNVEADFVSSIRENNPVQLTNFEDGLHYMKITEAVNRSLINHSQVNLDAL